MTEEQRTNIIFADDTDTVTKLPIPKAHGSDNDIPIIPVDMVPLPSRGVVYPVGHVLHNQTHVAIKAMTAREEDILTSAAFIKQGTVITQLLKSCLTDKSIDPDDIILGDRAALMTALRITGYGPEYKVETECPACEAKVEYEFDLSSLNVKFLEEMPLTLGENLFSVILPVSHVTLKFRLLNGRDETSIMQDQATRKKKLKTQLDNIITNRFSRTIVAVNDHRDRMSIVKFIENMPVRDSRFFRKKLEEIEPGIDMTGTLKCDQCGEISEVEVPMGPQFFWPDA